MNNRIICPVIRQKIKSPEGERRGKDYARNSRKSSRRVLWVQCGPHSCTMLCSACYYAGRNLTWVWHDPFTCVTWLFYMWHVSFISEWLVHTWHDSSIVDSFTSDVGLSTIHVIYMHVYVHTHRFSTRTCMYINYAYIHVHIQAYACKSIHNIYTRMHVKATQCTWKLERWIENDTFSERAIERERCEGGRGGAFQTEIERKCEREHSREHASNRERGKGYESERIKNR